MIFSLLVSVLLILLNGFFVAAEFAIVKVRVSQIEIYTEKGSFTRKVALHITRNLDAYLAATQLGITIASIGLGWVAEGAFAEIIGHFFDYIGLSLSSALIHKITFLFAFGLVTLLHVVFGELAPKSLSIRYPLKVTMFTAVPLRVFYFVFMPFIWLFNGFANLILRMLGIKTMHEHETHSEEEIRLLIGESKEGGKIDANEYELIQNVFDFDNCTVKQILTPRIQIYAVPIETPINEMIKRAIEEEFSRIPVYENSIDNIKGIVHSKDLLKLIGNSEGKSLQDIMREPYFVFSNKRIVNLLREFQKTKKQMAIVVDEYGGTLGLVTLEDIVEELVGDINDEFDNEVHIVEKTNENEFVVHAQSSIPEINKELPYPLPLGNDYKTLSGLLVMLLGRVPEIGDQILLDHYTATIIKKNRFTITHVKLTVTDNTTEK